MYNLQRFPVYKAHENLFTSVESDVIPEQHGFAKKLVYFTEYILSIMDNKIKIDAMIKYLIRLITLFLCINLLSLESVKTMTIFHLDFTVSLKFDLNLYTFF